MMNIVAILQARMGSSRLPGKVLKPILGRPMLEHHIERIKLSSKINRIVVATSIDPADQAIVDLCRQIGIESFEGELENVLDRFYQAARLYKSDHVVRLTGDCPLADPHLIDELIDFYFVQKCDYASNCYEPTLPDGLDAEVFSFAVLEQVWKEAVLPSHLEHVTPFIYMHPERFKIKSHKYHTDLSHLRWTVDEYEDLEFVRRIYEILYPVKPDFSMKDILLLLEKNPELAEINRRFKRNEGAKKSIEKDKQFLAQKHSH
ncbi:MAG: glycosyltransferase family protein [Desulfobacteraceae bacterium]|nr:glycosyltransferase family protein [Desulfobacteraceae bacterium]